MEKKWLSVAGLWLALIALVFIYTDRNEYTWRYEGDELGQIVISSEEADARQTQADAAMALEQQAAREAAEKLKVSPVKVPAKGAHGCQPLGNG